MSILDFSFTFRWSEPMEAICDFSTDWTEGSFICETDVEIFKNFSSPGSPNDLQTKSRATPPILLENQLHPDPRLASGKFFLIPIP